MKYKFILALLALSFVAAACNRNSSIDEQNPVVNPSSGQQGTSQQEGVSNRLLPGTDPLDVVKKSIEINMTSTGFSPAQVIVKKGTVVVFINKDTKSHWPASAPHPTHTDYPAFDPKRGIAPGETWSFTFDQVGSWGFHDHLFPSQTGKVNVTE